MKEFCVLLDNGHGKETPGKRSPKWEDGTQLFEWEYTREITKLVEKKLTELGIKTVRITPEDEDISLSTRAKRANSYLKDYSCIMVSVHCNASKNPNEGTGWEVWSTTAKNNSDKLAKCFTDNFKSVFPGWKLRVHKEKNWTVIYKTDCPCVLTENFFMDNFKDCKMMLSDKGKRDIAELHVRAILEYQEKYLPETVKGATVTPEGCTYR